MNVKCHEEIIFDSDDSHDCCTCKLISGMVAMLVLTKVFGRMIKTG